MKIEFKKIKKTFKVNLSPKKQAIFNSLGTYGYSETKTNNMKKQYLASSVMGLSIAGTDAQRLIQDYKRTKNSNHKIDSLTRSPYKLLKNSKFNNSKARRYSRHNAIKQIKIMKALGVENAEISSALTYSDAPSRCYAILKTRCKNALKLREDNLKASQPMQTYSAKVVKLKNQYKANMVRIPSETISEHKDFVGVEIEFISESGESHFKRRAEEMKIKNFNIGSDGSIEFDSDDYPDHVSHEIRILMENSEPYLKTQLKKLCTLLSINDAFVNASCGLHVHLDVRHKTAEEREEIGARFSRCLNVLASLVPKSRRDNSYCKLKRSDSDRYSAINMTAINKYSTIEIRLHSGTVDFLKIFNWIRLLNLIKDTKNAKTFNSLDEMIEVLKMPDDLALFYYNRYKKFNGNLTALNEETDLSESSVLTLDQITFTETNNQSATA
jgi:DNA-binding transcriptional MerR regulator